MKILWLTWKDRSHPETGGAEVVNEELAKRLVADGHEVHFIVGNFKKKNVLGEKTENRDGFTIRRIGNKYTAFLGAYYLYFREYRNWADLVIDEVNTVPYFSQFYIKQKRILFFHQLCREIWFYQIKFPISVIGYLLEPIYLWLMRKQKVITISESTKQDLLGFGFKKENIHIISEGIEMQALSKENFEKIKKYDQFTVLSLGAIRPMKRTLEAIKGFEEFMKQNTPDPSLFKEGGSPRLIIAGDNSGEYAKQVLEYVSKSEFKNNIQVLGRVSLEKKLELMQQAHVFAVTSIKEGWGLVVTEANSQGTIACVYNVDGLRDSVKNNITGYVTERNTPVELGEKFAQVYNDFFHFDGKKYREMQQTAYNWSKEITFDKSYQDLRKILSID